MLSRFWALCVLLVLAAAFMPAADPCWVQTPFGAAWVCQGPMPAPATPPAPVAPPTPPPFKPTFETGVSIQSPWGTWPLNEWYFATQETADTLCKRLLCAFVFSQPCDMGGGPFVCTKPERMLAFRDAITPQNAGILASFYVRNPEDQFPGLADKFVNAILQNLRDQKQR